MVDEINKKYTLAAQLSSEFSLKNANMTTCDRPYSLRGEVITDVDPKLLVEYDQAIDTTTAKPTTTTTAANDTDDATEPFTFLPVRSQITYSVNSSVIKVFVTYLMTFRDAYVGGLKVCQQQSPIYICFFNNYFSSRNIACKDADKKVHNSLKASSIIAKKFRSYFFSTVFLPLKKTLD